MLVMGHHWGGMWGDLERGRGPAVIDRGINKQNLPEHVGITKKGEGQQAKQVLTRNGGGSIFPVTGERNNNNGGRKAKEDLGTFTNGRNIRGFKEEEVVISGEKK